MPNEIFALILLAVALLALVDVFLGGSVRFNQPGVSERLSWREFATRPLPIFLFGVGVAMAPARPLTGAFVLLLALALGFAGCGRRCCRQES